MNSHVWLTCMTYVIIYVICFASTKHKNPLHYKLNIVNRHLCTLTHSKEPYVSNQREKDTQDKTQGVFPKAC